MGMFSSCPGLERILSDKSERLGVELFPPVTCQVTSQSNIRNYYMFVLLEERRKYLLNSIPKLKIQYTKLKRSDCHEIMFSEGYSKI